MDLLTVPEHEVGHLLGHDHTEGGVMSETLTPGVRLTFDGVYGGDPQVFATLPADAPPDPITDWKKWQ